MRVAQLWRYPVKSMQGEPLDTAVLEADGLRGDRTWALRDVTTGKVLTARREPRLLMATARLTDTGDPVVTLVDGTTVIGTGAAVDAALSQWLGRTVTWRGRKFQVEPDGTLTSLTPPAPREGRPLSEALGADETTTVSASAGTPGGT